VIFRQFQAGDGQLSYIFADAVTRRAVVLDPHLSLEQDYFDMLRQLGLSLEFAIETHSHESHLTAGPLLCEETGARWAMSRAAAVAMRFRKIDDGECFYLGEECFIAMATPGHSACSMCFRWRDRVFTGHTLLAAKTGDCNRPDANPATLHASIVFGLYALPEDTLICPGRATTAGVSSNIRFERECNSELTVHTSVYAFTAVKEQSARSGAIVVPRTVTERASIDLYPFRRIGHA
jgi:glyoxylase-like metal-dependent hydrolase (beta-lactamase superfamily II)